MQYSALTLRYSLRRRSDVIRHVMNVGRGHLPLLFTRSRPEMKIVCFYFAVCALSEKMAR